MKVRSSFQFEQLLDSEYSWRKQELATININLKSDKPHKREIWFRTGVVLLYAHWEGLIRFSAEAYLSYIVNQGVAFQQLQPCFLFFAVKSQLDNSGKVNLQNYSLFEKAQNLFSAPLSEKFNIDPKIHISTKEAQNLNSVEFKNILLKLGIPYLPKYELREKLVDEQLLNYRNKVAHGNSLRHEVADPLVTFETLIAKILESLESLRDQLIEAIKQKAYLKSAGP